MKQFLTIFLLIILSACQSESQVHTAVPESQSPKQNLKKELEQYNGFYTSIERTDGNISVASLPKSLLQNKKYPKSISIEHLSKIKNGYLLNFTIEYTEYKTLVVSTLNLKYEMIDYKMYPNGRNLTNFNEDTITVLTYDDNTICVQLMHPNEFNEPEFSIDGISKEVLKIDDKLILKK